MDSGIDIESAVFASEKFREIDRKLRMLALNTEFPMIEIGANTNGEVDWNYALLCASGLTSAPRERGQKAVLRVAIGCLRSSDTTVEQRLTAGALLERTGNRLAVELAEAKDLVPADAWLRLPPAFRLDVIRRKLELTLYSSNGANIPINRFQRDAWDALSSSDWTSISAPTSAGKSWVIRSWFVEKLRNADMFTGVYVVPTRALVVEVAKTLQRELPSAAHVFTLPWDAAIASSSKRIFVVTQERLHILQREHPEMPIDEMFVDEAQNLGDPGRGILLAQVIERAVRRNPTMRLTFASPLSSNPEELLKEAPAGVTALPLLSELATVNQNLLWVEKFAGNLGKRTVRLIHNGEPLEAMSITLAKRVSKVDESVAHIVMKLGGTDGGNVIYSNSPSRAESVASELVQLTPRLEKVPDSVKHLQDLLRSTIHPKYSLINSLERGIAFHYGNMPLTVRSRIEELFEEGAIQYLICTSTLLEGVNLPCRNIFIRNPRRGQDELRTEDFWNLAGRAGRWGKEFQGNIICIDTDKPNAWKEVPLVRRRGRLTRAVREGLQAPDRLLAFIRTDADSVSRLQESEGLFSYLCMTAAEGGESALGEVLGSSDVDSDREEIKRSVLEALNVDEVPTALILKHAGISPNTMRRLLAYFNDREISQLKLSDPAADDAHASYYRAFTALSASATNIFDAFGWTPESGKPDKRKHVLASLVVNWMRGMPLRMLVEQRIGGENDPKKVSASIRELLKDVEQMVRFQIPKYFDCYADLLDLVSLKRDGEVVADRPDLVKMLELGVSRPSLATLMTLGLSRTAALALPVDELDDEWTPTSALQWLKSIDRNSLKIPVLLIREIEDLVTTSSAPEA